MALELTPLSVEDLSPVVARATNASIPAQARMMAARGLAPMGPTDLVTAAYQLLHDPDPKVAKAAEETATKLPENILGAALGEALDTRVIHLFAHHVLGKAPLVEKILLNHHTADDTFVFLAGKLREHDLELLATNQQRLLRCPDIIEAFYFNKAARMSTVQRMLELAVRNGIDLPRIPQFKQIAANILGTHATDDAVADQHDEDVEDQQLDDETMDAIFAAGMFDEELGEDDAAAIAAAEDTIPPEQQKRAEDITRLPVNAKIRKATLGTAFDRAILIRDTNRSVAIAAITSPGVNEQEASRYAANRGLSEDIIRYIAEKREWLKNYQIKVALVNNPKCPLAHSMRLLTHLRAKDLQGVARSKNVPSALATAARRAGAARK